jgi:membrane associated rhomboid family serine protease
MFPIWDDQHHKGKFAPVTWLFLGINIVVFLHQASLDPASGELFIHTWGTIPAIIMSGEHLYTLVTNIFLHGWWLHLIGNMLFLYVFGDNIEKELWIIKYLTFYIIGWVIASLSHIILDPTSTIPAVWASGAIAALLWAYLIWFPKSRIKMISPYGYVFYIWALQFLWYWIVVQVISGVSSLGGVWWWVARWAHIGGFVFGVIVAWISGGSRGHNQRIGMRFWSSHSWRWFTWDERVRK